MPNVNGCEWNYPYLIRNLSRYIEDALDAYESWVGELPSCELEESDHQYRWMVYDRLLHEGTIGCQEYSDLYEFSVIVLDSLRLVRCIKDFLSRLEKGEKREGTERTIRRIQGNVLHADTLTRRNSDKRAAERWEHNKRDSEYRKRWREEELSSDDLHDLSRVSLLLSHSVSFAEDVQSILKQEEGYAEAMSMIVFHADKAIQQFEGLLGYHDWFQFYKEIEDQLYENGREKRKREAMYSVKVSGNMKKKFRQISYIEFLAQYLLTVAKSMREKLEKEAGL